MQVLRWPASTRSIFLEGQLARPLVRTLLSSCPGPYLDNRNGPLGIEILLVCVSFVKGWDARAFSSLKIRYKPKRVDLAFFGVGPLLGICAQSF